MLSSFSTTYTHRNTVHFVTDDDPRFKWLASFHTSPDCRFFLVVDQKAWKLFGDTLTKALRHHRKEIFLFTVPSGEKGKSLATYAALVDFLKERTCGLNDLLIGVGGGVVADVASFTASTYMRALPLALIPTTLIASVDASTAGKTCLNSGTTKNLLGTFYYPQWVYTNINLLKTTTSYITRQGLSEVFKYGLLGSRVLLSRLEAYASYPTDTLLRDVIDRTIRVRVRIRKKNPLASNLGHTFGHAIEKLSHFKILHGDAITIGTVMALHFGVEEGITKKETVSSIEKRMQALGLNCYLDADLDTDTLVDEMMCDKKSSSTKLNLVLLRDIAIPYETKGSFFYETDPRRVKMFLKRFKLAYPKQIHHCTAYIRNRNLSYTA